MQLDLHYIKAAADIWYSEGSKVFGPPIDEYVVEVIASHFDRPDICPDSPALRLLTTAVEAPEYIKFQTYQTLAEDCLLLASLCPDWKRKHGLGAEYLDRVGMTSYSAAVNFASGQHTKQLFTVMTDQFVAVRTFLNRRLKP